MAILYNCQYFDIVGKVVHTDVRIERLILAVPRAVLPKNCSNVYKTLQFMRLQGREIVKSNSVVPRITYVVVSLSAITLGV